MIILASNSPRRKELLQMLGVKFMVSPGNCEEISKSQDPAQMTMEIAMKKAYATHYSQDDIIIGADTIVYYDGKVYGKPRDKDHARAMLKAFSGKTHSVYTGVCILQNGESECFCSKTDVKFFELEDSLIEKYLTTGDSLDKAGSYGIQGKGALLVEEIHGDFYNVMGLPLARVAKKLRELSCKC